MRRVWSRAQRKRHRSSAPSSEAGHYWGAASWCGLAATGAGGGQGRLNKGARTRKKQQQQQAGKRLAGHYGQGQGGAEGRPLSCRRDLASAISRACRAADGITGNWLFHAWAVDSRRILAQRHRATFITPGSQIARPAYINPTLI